MAIYSIVLSIGFMIAFPMVGSIVQVAGWRVAWLVVGLALVAGLAPLSWLLARRGPEALDDPPALDGATWQQAVATPAFWLFSVGAALYGLVASGIGLFNESILAERGFGADVYYPTLIVTALTALLGNFGGGWLAIRMSLPRLMAMSLFVLAAGLAALPHVTTIGQVMAWATAMGLAARAGHGVVLQRVAARLWPQTSGPRPGRGASDVVLAIALLTSAASAQRPSDTIAATGGDIVITAVAHGTVHIAHGPHVVLVDPTLLGGWDGPHPGNVVPKVSFEGLKPPTHILITDVHGDHLDGDSVAALRTPMIDVVVPGTGGAGGQRIPRATQIANGQTKTVGGVSIEAVPMYNIVRGPTAATKFHDKGRRQRLHRDPWRQAPVFVR